MSGWKDIRTAPVGEPSMDVGSRDASRWFMAKMYTGDIIKAQRLHSNHTYAFRDDDETYYNETWLTHWREL